MHYHNVIIAGFGGQGVMLIGNLLAHAGMNAGLHVTYIPVYGPEMRGGTANCTVVVSDREIGSPLVYRPKGLIAMNPPSVKKFQPRLQDSGVHIINSSLIDREMAETSRIASILVPCNDIANELGNARMANMVAIGAFVQASGVLPVEEIQKALHQVISPRYKDLIPSNAEAIARGAATAAQQMQ